ncbi:PREDICTED: uncharacterized protein LOC104804219 [Tarenaya hassleriana]|uniref:uncharacterized protein LOC104804219 n=1 Tax=Tarenaya hassleriana TaxID=28532 RepID=UPI00053C0C1C|nr:PREDICTED: uncharacterized protein LOC104804219 [Tarenaya hassleriana]
MASTASFSLLGGNVGLQRARNAHVISCKAQLREPFPPPLPSRAVWRRELLFSLTAATVVTARQSESMAGDIPLFGIRKQIRKAEEEAVEIVKEGFETAEKGIEAAEKGIEAAERGIQTAERGIQTAEREIETAVSFGGLAQAGAVAAAEFVGVVVATSVVNGILGPEAQKS